jgi:enoyl-CoA hydratase/carnithine racemase
MAADQYAEVTDFSTLVAGLAPSRGRINIEDFKNEHGWERVITVDSPETRNALTPQMMLQLGMAVEGAKGAKNVTVRGANGTFCSGGDLNVLKANLMLRGSGRIFGGFMQQVALSLKNLPSVAIVEGVALGGGAELALACSRVEMAAGAKIGFIQAKLGVSPGFGGGRWLVERLGPQKAGEILLQAGLLSASEALFLGLVDTAAEEPSPPQVHSPPLIAPEVQAGITRILEAAPLSRAEALAVELEVFTSLWGGPAHAIALNAALSRRS